MGYTTEFEGQVTIEPPLNEAEIAYIKKFGDTRRMKRKNGPYFVDGTGFAGQGHDADVTEFNYPPEGQPGLWCQWEPTEDGTAIQWDGSEKFYHAAEWMEYIIDHFLKPGAEASNTFDSEVNQFDKFDSQFADFTFDHVVNGKILANGEDPSDIWVLYVNDNAVSVKEIEW